METIQPTRHPPDLVGENATMLRLGVKVGTKACGPTVREDLMSGCKEVSFGFGLEHIWTVFQEINPTLRLLRSVGVFTRQSRRQEYRNGVL